MTNYLRRNISCRQLFFLDSSLSLGEVNNVNIMLLILWAPHRFQSSCLVLHCKIVLCLKKTFGLSWNIKLKGKLFSASFLKNFFLSFHQIDLYPSTLRSLKSCFICKKKRKRKIMLAVNRVSFASSHMFKCIWT